MRFLRIGSALTLIWFACLGSGQAYAQDAVCRRPLFLPPDNAAGLPKIENRVAVALRSPISPPYYGSSSSAYLKAARGDMINAIYLSTLVALTDGDHGAEPKERVRHILLNWANTAMADQFATEDGPGTVRTDYAGLGLYVGWIGVGAAASYSILHCRRALSPDEDEKIRAWLRRIASVVLEGRRRWVASNYFGGQVANNHLSMHNLAVFTIGAVLNDRGLMRWAYDSPDNTFNFVTSISAIIYNGQEKDTHSGGGNQPLPQRGEIYDRYRMSSGHGLHYAFFQILLLGLFADIAGHFGEHPYSIVGANGETLKDAFLYYGQFLVISRCDVNASPLVAADSKNRAFYANAKVEAIYWNWIIPFKRHFRSDPQLRPLIEQIDAARCERPAAEYAPVPFIAALYE